MRDSQACLMIKGIENEFRPAFKRNWQRILIADHYTAVKRGNQIASRNIEERDCRDHIARQTCDSQIAPSVHDDSVTGAGLQAISEDFLPALRCLQARTRQADAIVQTLDCKANLRRVLRYRLQPQAQLHAAASSWCG
ncbi:MAG: hypothetical protein ABIO17_02195 [Pseudoxanthomonas sp.]